MIADALQRLRGISRDLRAGEIAAGQYSVECPVADAAGHESSAKSFKLAADKLDAVLATVREPQAPSFVWLIELGCNPPEYWAGRRESRYEFTPNPHDALRFARFEDAEVVRCHIVDSKIRLGCKSVQHGFTVEARVPHKPPAHIVQFAIEASTSSPCRSKRGVVIFRGADLVSQGYNYKPRGFDCDGSDACKATCRDEAVHAEQQALLLVGRKAEGCDLLHVKTVDGMLVPSGPPSCVQCSKLALVAGILGVWLLRGEDGWVRYPIQDFHRLSLEAHEARAAQPLDWQPIATAPKGSWPDGPDDTRDPAYVSPPHLWLTLPDGQRCVGSFDAYYAEGGNGYDGAPPWVEEFSGERINPTHWMPLPAPPAAHAAPTEVTDGRSV